MKNTDTYMCRYKYKEQQLQCPEVNGNKRSVYILYLCTISTFVVTEYLTLFCFAISQTVPEFNTGEDRKMQVTVSFVTKPPYLFWYENYLQFV